MCSKLSVPSLRSRHCAETILSVNQAVSLKHDRQAVEKLAATSPQAAELVKLRYFGGLSNAEAAAVLGVSPRKANQIWAYARAWLGEELGGGADE